MKIVFEFFYRFENFLYQIFTYRIFIFRFSDFLYVHLGWNYVVGWNMMLWNVFNFIYHFILFHFFFFSFKLTIFKILHVFFFCWKNYENNFFKYKIQTMITFMRRVQKWSSRASLIRRFPNFGKKFNTRFVTYILRREEINNYLLFGYSILLIRVFRPSNSRIFFSFPY